MEVAGEILGGVAPVVMLGPDVLNMGLGWVLL